MTQAGAASSEAPPERDLVGAARELSALADAGAVAAEAQGALADDVVEALHETGLWAMWVPRELGGAELEPVPSLEVLEHISYGDASAGWVLMAAALATGVDAAYLGDEAAAELFGPRACSSTRARARSPAGRSRPTAATCSAASGRSRPGIKHAQIIHTGMRSSRRPARLRIAVFPIEQATLIDNWDVMGLRATGSIDYTTDSACSCRSPTPTTRRPRRRCAAAASTRWGSSTSAMICHSGVGARRRAAHARRAARRCRRTARPPRAASARTTRFLGDFAMAEAKCARRGRSPTATGTRTRRRCDAATSSHARAEHAQPPGAPARDLDRRGGLDVRLRERRHDGAARGHDPALLPRHARRAPST